MELKEKKNILFIISARLHINEGGVQRVTHLLASQFLKEGHSVSVFCTVAGTDEIYEGLEVHYLNNINAELSFVLTDLISQKSINVIINQSALFRPLMNQILKAIKDTDIRLISVHHNCIQCLENNYLNIIKYNLKSNKLSKLLKIPFFLKLASIYGKYKLRSDLQLIYNNSDYIVLLFNTYIDELKSYINENGNCKIVAIENPATYSDFDIDLKEKENSVLFVGRLNMLQKQVDILLKIWSNIEKRNNRWRLDIVGDGPDKEYLEGLANQLGLTNIFFHGRTAPEKFYLKAKLFCMTSAFEGSPMVLYEAMKFGVVPIVFDTFGGVGEIVKDGKNGLIIEPYNLKLYESTMDRLMNNDELLNSFMQNTINALYAPDLNTTVNKWRNLLNEINL